MFNSGRKKNRAFSYADQKKQKHRKRYILLGIAAVFIVYTSFTSLVFSMAVLENETMAPNLRAGERFIFSSYNIYSLFSGLDFDTDSLPFRRGNIVMVDMLKGTKIGFFRRAADWIARFFTAQRVSIIDRGEHRFVKRVIGLPGDEVSMTNFVIRVKAKGSSYSLTEFEVTEQDYTLDIPQTPALWDSSIPFSGNMDVVVLGENECFVLSDDRSNTNDSRSWGPVLLKNISGKALFRYWPFTRLGRP
jgi:signal peptidase I